jgi:anthranilate synthase component 1
MQLVSPDFERFQELAERHNRVQIAVRLVCDDLTPVGAYARLQAGAQRAFLLESVVGGEKIARYSFLGADPDASFSVTRDVVRIVNHTTGTERTLQCADPLRELETRLGCYQVAPQPGLPRFVGGAVGYAGYDAVRYVERLGAGPPDDRHLPDLLFDIYETVVIFDHVHKTVLVVTLAPAEPDDSPDRRRAAYDAALARLDAVVARLAEPVALPPVRVTLPAPAPHLERYASSFDRPAFERMVAACQEYIRAGDIFQVVVSQRLSTTTAAEPLDIYRALRVINPAPFMFCIKSPEVTLVGASPEVMCRVEDGVVTNRPLAGTRRRGTTEEEDRRLRDELLADPKERAEHIMLVDLGRNDVGRVCRPNSVRLADVMSIEYYSHVMHISSTVTGALAAGRTAFDALRATLPVGTVSGAPKVRALQIIDELEPVRRGPYGGAAGYIDFAGNMDTCIALRTLVLMPHRSGRHRVDVQVGAGIVADSAPAAEYQETINKAQGMLAAVRMAEERFSAD